MNKIYKLVWSKTRNMYIAVCEFAKTYTKSSVQSFSRVAVGGLVGFLFMFLNSGIASATMVDTPDVAGVTIEQLQGLDYSVSVLHYAFNDSNENNQNTDYALYMVKDSAGNSYLGIPNITYSQNGEVRTFNNYDLYKVNSVANGNSSDVFIIDLSLNGNSLKYNKSDIII